MTLKTSLGTGADLKTGEQEAFLEGVLCDRLSQEVFLPGARTFGKDPGEP